MLYSRHQVFRWLLVDNLFLAKAKVTALLLRAKAKKVVSKYSHKYISLVLREYGHGMEALSLLTRWGTTNPDFKSLPG
jgi:hypothetical protein